MLPVVYRVGATSALIDSFFDSARTESSITIGEVLLKNRCVCPNTNQTCSELKMKKLAPASVKKLLLAFLAAMKIGDNVEKNKIDR